MTKNRLLIIFLFLTHCCIGQVNFQYIPELNTIYNVDENTRILNKSLPNSGKILLVFYDPGCSHCQKFAQAVSKNSHALKKVSTYFIAMQDAVHIKGFVNMFASSLASTPNVSFWRDPGTEFIEKFLPENYPAVYLYDGNSRKLLYSAQGEDTVDRLLTYVGQ